jgi:hypothetical protein
LRLLALALGSLLLAGPASAESEWPYRSFDKAGSGAVGTAKGSARPKGAGIQAKAGQNGQGPAAAIKGVKAKVQLAALTKSAREKEMLRQTLRPANGPWAWKVTRETWTDEDEKGFEKFIVRIAESDCKDVHSCLTSREANPDYYNRHPTNIAFFADCADLPYVLRAYYAWQNGLPFSFPMRLGYHPKSVGHATRLVGYQVVERHDITGPGPDVRLALHAVSGFVSTEYFRSPPAYAGRLMNDYYPVRLSRESIKAGTVLFDPDGHVAIVYKVSDDGLIHYMDAHPDNSLSRGIFGRDFARAEPPMGAGFKRWRPQKLVGARRAPDRTLHGGKIELARDQDLADWSDEQYFGNQTPRPKVWSEGRFALNGQSMDYHDYVRMNLAYPGFKYDPLAETRTMMRQLCRDLGYRVDAVDRAIKAGLHRRQQPDRLPKNIYATSGDWEIYSTPSRDARIKSSFEELKDELARFIELERKRSSLLSYSGAGLREDLLAVYQDEAAACTIAYKRSDGSVKQLGFEEVKRRLFNMSFDPHHCVERRWGADDPEELSTCSDDKLKTTWYVAQQRLRNQLVRTYGEPMGWNLAELQNEKLDIGIVEPPDLDVVRVLKATETADAD